MRLAKVREKVWFLLSNLVRWYYIAIYKHEIGKNVVISYKAGLDKGVPGKIHIGEGTYVLARAHVLAHDRCRAYSAHTYIGKHCVIGIGSLILPGLHIGNEVVVGG